MIKIKKIKLCKINFSKSSILIIEDDKGIKGYSQLLLLNEKSQIEYLKTTFSKLIKNKKFYSPNDFWSQIYWLGLRRFGWIQVLSSLEIAFNDLFLKKKGENFINYIYKKKINRQLNVEFYWSIGHGYKKTNLQMMNDIELGLKLGFKKFKIRMDWHEYYIDENINKDYKMFKYIRKILPKDCQLAFDANAGYSLKNAIFQARRLKDGGAVFFEEPVNTLDNYALKKIIDKNILPVTFGEYEENPTSLINLAQTAKLNFLQPDILNIGGITNFLKVFKYCKSQNLYFFPHSPDIGINSVVSAIIYSSGKKFYAHEFSPEIYKYNIKIIENIFNEAVIPYNGILKLNSNVGFGLSLNKKSFKKLTERIL